MYYNIPKTKTFFKRFKLKGRCSICGLFTYVNKHFLCSKCFIERNAKQGIFFCQSCGKKIKRTDMQLNYTTVYCTTCRKIKFNEIINSTVLKKTKEEKTISPYIEDEEKIKEIIIEKLKTKAMTKNAIRKFFIEKAILTTLGFKVLNDLMNQGIVEYKLHSPLFKYSLKQ